jgi:hypothetical protein
MVDLDAIAHFAVREQRNGITTARLKGMQQDLRISGKLKT